MPTLEELLATNKGLTDEVRERFTADLSFAERLEIFKLVRAMVASTHWCTRSLCEFIVVSNNGGYETKQTMCWNGLLMKAIGGGIANEDPWYGLYHTPVMHRLGTDFLLYGGFTADFGDVVPRSNQYSHSIVANHHANKIWLEDAWDSPAAALQDYNDDLDRQGLDAGRAELTRRLDMTINTMSGVLA